jgi:hypothetical protein
MPQLVRQALPHHTMPRPAILCRQRVSCLCEECVTSAGPAGLEMTAIEFERHGGWGTYKKWKRSITVSALQ